MDFQESAKATDSISTHDGGVESTHNAIPDSQDDVSETLTKAPQTVDLPAAADCPDEGGSAKGFRGRKEVEAAEVGAYSDPHQRAVGQNDNAAVTQPFDFSVLVSELKEIRLQSEQRADEYQETIRSLQEKNEDLRNQQLVGLMKPLFQRLADMHAELTMSAEQSAADGHQSYSADFASFALSVESFLDLFDLESVGASAGDTFDRREHAAVMVKQTEEVERDQTIARVARQGFRVIGQPRVLIPARVTVWKYRPAGGSTSNRDPGAVTAESAIDPPAEVADDR